MADAGLPAASVADVPAASVASAPSQASSATALAFAGIVMIGGANWVAVRLSNRELDPFWGAASRFTAAAFILFWIVAARRVPLPQGRALGGAMLYGGLGIGVSYALAYWALQEITAGLGSVIVATTPLVTLCLAVAQGQERFRLQTFFGAVLAVAGIALIVRDSIAGRVSLPHVVAMFGMPLAIAQSAIIARRFPSSHPVAFNAVGMATGAAFLLGASVLAGETFAAPALGTTQAAWLYLVASSCALFTLFLYVIKRWSATATNYSVVLMPLVTVPLSALIAREGVETWFILQAALVLLGTYLGIRRPRTVSKGPADSSAPT